MIQASATPVVETATTLQLWGASAFGVLIGWYVYYINRWRTSEVQIGDLATLVGVIGGGAVLALFPARSDLFGAYGVGLFSGFFGYFLALVILVWRSEKFGADFFLDGRRKAIGADESYGPVTQRPMVGPVGPR